MYIKTRRDNACNSEFRDDERYWAKSYTANKCEKNSIWYDDDRYPRGSCGCWYSDECKYKGSRNNVHICKKLVEKKIIFVPPPKDGVTKLQSMDEQVKIDKVRVGNGYVIIWGHLLKTIIYDTVKKDTISKLENDDGKDEDECFIIDGVVRHATCYIPFKYFVEIEGINEDDEVKIAASKIDNSSTNIYEQEKICTCMKIGITKYIKGVFIKDLIEFKIKKIWY